MPLVATRGAASAQGFGEFAQQTAVNYIEDVFSTWLYTGNGSTQTITNGIDLSTKGGLVWIKDRTSGWANQHQLVDTARGATKVIYSDSTVAEATSSQGLTTFSSTGFSIGTNGNYNRSTNIYASWTFRKQAKFFDVVTYTGNGVAGRAISHNLGSVPGCIIVKGTSFSSVWRVWHRAVNGGQARGQLENTAAFITTDAQNYWGNNSSYIAPTSTNFTVSDDADLNSSGQTYVAYLFAHDAGGFGLTGTDNVISCGSVTGSQTVNLGYEPQLVISKYANGTGDWSIVDNMRGAPTPASGTTPYPNVLVPNTSAAEVTSGLTGSAVIFNATGFRLNPDTVISDTYIYIAIRRGPMKTPTTGTSVFSPNAFFSTAGNKQTTGFPVDTVIGGYLGGFSWAGVATRLIGSLNTTTTSANGYSRLLTTSTAAEFSTTNINYGYDNTGYLSGGLYGGSNNIMWSFRRAPGFFDVVCYTGNNVNNRQLPHNLGVVPELVINKSRSNPTIWYVWANGISPSNKCLILNLTLDWSSGYNTGFQSSTSTNLNISTASGEINISGETYVAYLFASCPGVSKVTNFTGTGALQTINCGFTGGARLVLIKRTDSTGDWYIWDSSRGISSSTDPYLLLNSTAAEVTTTNWVDTTSTGFQVTAASGNNVNINGASYIALAIA